MSIICPPERFYQFSNPSLIKESIFTLFTLGCRYKFFYSLQLSWEMLTPCFNLYFFKYWWAWASFHMYIHCSCVLFGLVCSYPLLFPTGMCILQIYNELSESRTCFSPTEMLVLELCLWLLKIPIEVLSFLSYSNWLSFCFMAVGTVIPRILL